MESPQIPEHALRGEGYFDDSGWDNGMRLPLLAVCDISPMANKGVVSLDH